MKFEWYENLSSREQRFVLLGSVVVAICLIYLLMIAPISSHLDDMQSRVNSDRQLVGWMKTSVPLLENKRLLGSAALKSVPPESVNTVIEQSLKQVNLDASLKQITKDNNGVITLTFDSISFDNFIDWLIHLSTNNRLTIMQISVTPAKQAGVVGVVLKIKFN